MGIREGKMAVNGKWKERGSAREVGKGLISSISKLHLLVC